MRVTLLFALVVVVGCGSVSSEKMDAATGSADAAKDAPTSCPIGTMAMCSGDDLITCDSQGNITNTKTCTLGCDTTNKKCLSVDPSNNLATQLDDAATAPDLVLSGSATIDTDAGSIVDQSGARTQPNVILSVNPIGIFVIKAKTFETGGTVTVVGSRALAIVVDGTVTINHAINLNAPIGGNGPGAIPTDVTGRGGDGQAGATEGQSGGGGGGFGTAGGRGGTGGVATVNGGNPGGVVGNGTLVPLRGGTPGGHAGIPNASYTAGGGGGAIQIVSNTSITFGAAGLIAANGGGGHGPNNILCLVNTPCGHGEGGGSGGGILLETPVLTMDPAAGIFANGGGGSCGVSGSASGGTNTATPAAGQTCGGQTGNGGNGAAGATAAQNGGNTSGDNAVGGAGGGGAGRIRVNLKAGSSFSPAGTVSPAASAGAVNTR